MEWNSVTFSYYFQEIRLGRIAPVNETRSKPWGGGEELSCVYKELRGAEHFSKHRQSSITSPQGGQRSLKPTPTVPPSVSFDLPTRRRAWRPAGIMGKAVWSLFSPPSPQWICHSYTHHITCTHHTCHITHIHVISHMSYHTHVISHTHTCYLVFSHARAEWCLTASFKWPPLHTERRTYTPSAYNCMLTTPDKLVQNWLR